MKEMTSGVTRWARLSKTSTGSWLLNTTLNLAEAEAGALHIDRDPVDFSDAVRQLVDVYQPAMAEHHHEVTTDIEEHVVVDADITLLNRVVSNLLENELTHLPAGCRVEIRLRSQQGSAELVIEDNGPGFSPDIGSQVFKRFVKGKNSPSMVSDLPLWKQLPRRMGAWLRSRTVQEAALS
jgi:signal transduction histidine kinase